jgi:hypothetical protein
MNGLLGHGGGFETRITAQLHAASYTGGASAQGGHISAYSSADGRFGTAASEGFREGGICPEALVCTRLFFW